MGSIVSVDPFRCRLWQLHDRLEDHVTEESCKAEIQSFAEHGQLVPALGRPLREDSEFDVELIYGARRLFVARHVRQPLLVELRELSDMQAIVAMDMENRQRRDISPYERGLSYARWLRGGIFESQDDIARALNVSASQVSRLLKVARLPSIVIDAFGSALHIHEAWGLELAELLENPVKRQMVIRAARAIASISPRPQAREVYRRLLASVVTGRTPRSACHDKVIKGENGAPLFRVRQQRNSIALLLPMQRVSAKSLEHIENAIARILVTSFHDDGGVVRKKRLHDVGM